MNKTKKYIIIKFAFLILIGSCKSDKITIQNCDCKNMDLVVENSQFRITDSLVIHDLRNKIIDLKTIKDDGRVIFGDTILFNCSSNMNLMVLINEDYIKIQDIKYKSQKSIDNILRKLEAKNHVKIKLEKALSNKDSVKELSLRHCNLYSIPEEVFELQNLEILDLSLNLIEEIPNEISKLKNLKQLSISYNRLKTINPKISQLESIEWLWFLDNKLKSLPNEICQLKKLKDLNLTLNLLEELPSCIPEMDSLKNLALGREKKHEKRIISQIKEFKIKNKYLNIIN